MGVTLLTTSHVAPDTLAFCSDTTPEKQGTWIPGLRVPVISPEEARTRRPNVYVLLARNYRDEIIAKEADFLNAGGRFLVPIPELELVGAGGQHDPGRSGVMTPEPAETSKPADLTSLVPVFVAFAAFQQLRAASELQLFEYLDPERRVHQRPGRRRAAAYPPIGAPAAARHHLARPHSTAQGSSTR